MIRFLYIVSVPFIIFTVLGIATLLQVHQSTDLGGMNAMIGASFLFAGCAICQLRLILQLLAGLKGRLTHRFWFLSALLFLLIFYDAAFGIHERMLIIGLPEISFFLVEGALLASLFLPLLPKLPKIVLVPLSIFGLLAIIALIGDNQSSGEGTLELFGRTISYEQSTETLSVFCLLCAYIGLIIHDTRTTKNTTN